MMSFRVNLNVTADWSSKEACAGGTFEEVGPTDFTHPCIHVVLSDY